MTDCGNSPFSDAVRVVADAVFPRRCPVCDDAVHPFGADVCTDCAQKIKPFRHIRTDGVHAFSAVFSVFPYREAAPSVYRFKYLGRREYAGWYARRFSECFGGLPQGIRIDALIPVPLHKDKQRLRGYNQAEAFARALSVHLKTPVINDLVARVRDTSPQKNMKYHERRNNLKNAFIMSRNDVKYKSVALVDDIFTTGSTADEIAALLQKNGIPEVYVFTIAAAIPQKWQQGGNCNGCQELFEMR